MKIEKKYLASSCNLNKSKDYLRKHNFFSFDNRFGAIEPNYANKFLLGLITHFYFWLTIKNQTQPKPILKKQFWLSLKIYTQPKLIF